MTAANAVAPATSYPWPTGSKGMLALWLLLTTNPNFLLNPAAEAASKGLRTFTPGYGSSKIQNWPNLYHALVGVCGDDYGKLEPTPLQDYLTTTLQTAVTDWNGQTITDASGNAMTYATVLAYTCRVFDVVWPTFLAWGHPSPDTIDEAVQ